MNRLRSLLTLDNYAKMVGAGCYLGAGSGLVYGAINSQNEESIDDKFTSTIFSTGIGIMAGGLAVGLLPFSLATGAKMIYDKNQKEKYLIYKFDNW